MTAETYAREVEFVMYQIEQGTLDVASGYGRLTLLTLAYRSEPGWVSFRG